MYLTGSPELTIFLHSHTAHYPLDIPRRCFHPKCIHGTTVGQCVLCGLDLANGYWQVPVAEKDRQKTAFVTPDGLYEFNRMPFGLAYAPASFQRLMDEVLKRLKWTASIVHLNDILVFEKLLKSIYVN